MIFYKEWPTTRRVVELLKSKWRRLKRWSPGPGARGMNASTLMKVSRRTASYEDWRSIPMIKQRCGKLY